MYLTDGDHHYERFNELWRGGMIQTCKLIPYDSYSYSHLVYFAHGPLNSISNKETFLQDLRIMFPRFYMQLYMQRDVYCRCITLLRYFCYSFFTIHVKILYLYNNVIRLLSIFIIDFTIYVYKIFH